MMILPFRWMLCASFVALSLLAGVANPLPGAAPAADPHARARRVELRRVLHFNGSKLLDASASAALGLQEWCDGQPRIRARAGDSSGAEPACARERFRASLAVGTARILGPPPSAPGWRLEYHRIAAMRQGYEQVELRCDLDADGDITSADIRVGGEILAGLATPTGRELLQLDVSPVGAPDGWLDARDLAIVEQAVAGETASCEVPVARLRRLRDVDADGVLRIACLGDSNSCLGNPFACGPIRGLCSFLQELSPQIATADGAVLPSEFISYAWSGTTVCHDPSSPRQLGARPQYALSRSRVDPGPADAVVVAFGTNDHGVLDKSPGEIAQCYQEIMSSADADGIPAWIALTPPVMTWPGFRPEYVEELALRNRHVERTNRVLRRTFPVNSLVDLFSGFDRRGLFRARDPLHLNDAGQRLRAERVLDAVR